MAGPFGRSLCFFGLVLVRLCLEDAPSLLHVDLDNIHICANLGEGTRLPPFRQFNCHHRSPGFCTYLVLNVDAQLRNRIDDRGQVDDLLGVRSGIGDGVEELCEVSMNLTNQRMNQQVETWWWV